MTLLCPLTSEIHGAARSLSAKGIHTTIKWVRGHAGIHGNELADQAAKKIATEAKSMEDPIIEPLTMTAAKKIVSSGTRDRWQSQWDKCSKAQALHEFCPHIPISGYHSITNHNTEKRLFWLKSGYTHLNSELFKYGYVDTPTCLCGLEEETVPHLLLNCPQSLH